MSGGVDSSVAAALLAKQGFDVQGIFFRFWSAPDAKGKNLCCSYDAQLHAQAVAQKLGIKLKVIDLKTAFKKQVVDYFLKEQKAGRTPNPCIQCNQFIKFKLASKSLIATGHYAKRMSNVKCQMSNLKQGLESSPSAGKAGFHSDYKLLQASDKKKDQSYFLYTLTQAQLKNVLFPIGSYTKAQVRAIAKKMNLPYRKEESFDICFIGQSRLRDFLKKYLKLQSGKIVDTAGCELGEHKGLSLYTTGQRAGLGGGLYYVLKLNSSKNQLVVTKNEKDLYSKELEVEKWHWISGSAPRNRARLLAQIRYHHKPALAEIRGKKVMFKKPQRAITPGQSVVVYKGDEVLGGGIICS